MEYFLATLGSLLTQAPVLLTWIIGAVLAIIFWRKHPAVSMLTLIAFSGFLILAIANSYLSTRLPGLMIERGLGASNAATIFMFKGIVFSIIDATFWIILTVAIFGWRKKDKE